MHAFAVIQSLFSEFFSSYDFPAFSGGVLKHTFWVSSSATNRTYAKLSQQGVSDADSTLVPNLAKFGRCTAVGADCVSPD